MVREPAIDPPVGPRPRLVRLVALGLFLASTALHGRVTTTLAHLNVMSESNVLFDADPLVYTISFAQGRNADRWGGRSFAHPHITNLIYPLVSGVAAVAHGIAPGIDTDALRRRLSLTISPLAAGAETAVVFVMFLMLGVTMPWAVLLAALSTVTFSPLVFAAVPESYALSGLALALLTCVAIHQARSATDDRRLGLWVPAGLFVTGMTITNLAAVSWLSAACALVRTHRLTAALRRSTEITLAVLLVTTALYIPVQRMFGGPPFYPSKAGQIDELGGFRFDVLLRGMPQAFEHTFAPPPPIAMPSDNEGQQQRHMFILAYRSDAGPIRGDTLRAVVFLLLVVACAAGYRWAAPWQQAVAVGSAAIVLWNWIMHTCYGTELFLYSQHWEVAMLVLLAGALWWPGRFRVAGRAVLLGFAVLCAWTSAVALSDVVRVLRGG